MVESPIKVRFAPSPTGFLHIGSARTALFNWIFSQKEKGEFILRIEDTDINRSKDEFLEEILDSLRWLGIRWGECIFQSKRLPVYREYAKRLVDEGKAHAEQDAIVFTYDFDRVAFDDLIRGHIVFNELPKNTEVLIKSDGTPTYNFACCIDDALLGITHVIRGEDHIPNTPKQVLISRALGFTPPRFAHLPMILSGQGGKLSKRFGATSLREYRSEGFLPQALVNYLLLLGWSPKNNIELISWKDAVEAFALKHINKTAAAFSLEKLKWMNAEYIKKEPLHTLLIFLKEYMATAGFQETAGGDAYLEKVLVLFRNRMSTLSDIAKRGYCFFKDDFTYSVDAADILKRRLSREVRFLKERLSTIENFGTNSIEAEFRAAAQDLGLKARDLVHPVRVALTGQRVGPGLFETMEVLGKEKVLGRLERLLVYWEKEVH